jgi:hypothetical protein
MPAAHYDRLSIAYEPQPTQQRLSVFLKTKQNHRTYVKWMTEVIKAHMKPGERGLVVCKQILFDFESIPSWPQGDARFKERELFSKKYGWEIDGRHLCAIHWGTGIGDNAWNEADAVLLFDEFHIPRRSIIATAQGLLGHRATQGALGSMRSLKTKVPVIETLWDGHLLRWSKQMALRGRARCYDENGVCGRQKLVFTGDERRLLSHYSRLFPGAATPSIPKSGSALTREQQLYEIISRPGLPNSITTSWIGQQMGVPWREVGKDLMCQDSVKQAIGGLGWRYARKLGRGGGTFERMTTPTALAA